MSSKSAYVDIYALYTEFAESSDDYERYVLAKTILQSQEKYQVSEEASKLTEACFVIVHESDFFVEPEFGGLVFRSYDGNFNVFYHDEDGILIDAVFGIESYDSVLNEFKRMIVRASIDRGVVLYGEGDNMRYVASDSLKRMDMSGALAAYGLLVSRVKETRGARFVSAVDWRAERESLRAAVAELAGVKVS